MQSIETQNLLKNLERWRTSQNLSQAEFARRIRLHPSTYSKLLAGDTSSITADTIRAIYQVTGFLCFHLMEWLPEDDMYLRLGVISYGLTHEELRLMCQMAEGLLALRQ